MGKYSDRNGRKRKKLEVKKLGDNILNDAEIPSSPYSSWQLYKSRLQNQGFSTKSIRSIEKSSFDILKSLSMDTTESGPIKGLVVGNVQSGKTANMAGLMSLAADNGFNYFIVLSGVIENLRKQTANRLYEDMNSSGRGNLKWNHVENPKPMSRFPEHNISNFNLGTKDKDRYFTVCLKNKSRLNKLKRWLLSDKNKAKQMKVLIIDDEADQASINTKKIEEEYSTINALIRELVNNDKFAAMNYISYTATPYANVLNETNEDTLYPKNFIKLLEPSEDYIGPKQLFGSEIPERSPKIDIVKEITDVEYSIINDIQKGVSDDPIPLSFKESIHWFLISVATMRVLNHKKPISMLVHTSFKIDHHEIIAKKIEDYLKHIKENFESIINVMELQYQSEKETLNRDIFLENIPDYSTPDKVPEYPQWEDVIKELEYLLKENEVSNILLDNEGEPIFHTGIHLAIDNSRTRIDNQTVRLIYPNKTNMPQKAPAFIVVGGNTLSRGLTLEGLTTTYFLRTTNQADTLMQMGRWFGFRKGYEVFPRVWMDQMALNRFTFLSQMNEELREEIQVYAETGNSPLDYAPRIKNSPNYKLIRITSSNKQQSAEALEFDFAGFNSQTIYFEKDKAKLDHNYFKTQEFLNSLSKPILKRNKLIWRNVNSDKVNEFLTEYKICTSDTKMGAIPALIEWLADKGSEFEKWSVILSSTGDVENPVQPSDNWNIHGYSPDSVIRSQLAKRSNEEIISIGSLRRPEDLYADIDAELSSKETSSAKVLDVKQTREKYNYGNVPQLIIYRIDKGDKSRNKTFNKSRKAIQFDQDLIGINIMLPGVSQNENMTKYVSAKIDLKDQYIDEEIFEEEDVD
ncbi:Z1 domain-containing protein [Staphylococcus gallinarum]|uniref:Z1 domain-containing protein n=1 Tax=Staphylococcus gallinarum TaxID=1293 RepID=UPI00217566BA|nr:Z1 domain-containing protein [Staphylococcus gallinarum]